jgi:hypothetical protein
VQSSLAVAMTWRSPGVGDGELRATFSCVDNGEFPLRPVG